MVEIGTVENNCKGGRGRVRARTGSGVFLTNVTLGQTTKKKKKTKELQGKGKSQVAQMGKK